ncbi:MAG TPA: long-chain fatty acid--CoA ligase, partial [Acidimicrobiia bacterium]|nr:long-chain fatty acid--CoA ligase [Acidimicrobiia bacterium]
VAHVAVVPGPDPVMGEVGIAFVVARDAAAAPTVDGLREFGRDRLAAYKLPEGLRIVDALPLTAGEKVDRRALRVALDRDSSNGDSAAGQPA